MTTQGPAGGLDVTTDDRGNVISSTPVPGASNRPQNPNASTALNFVDFSQLIAPFVNYQAAFDFAQGVGRDNANTYYNNLTSDRTKNAALSLVDTDIEGINRGLNAFIPRIRQEGNIDTEFNIARGGRIDQFNQSRIPGINQFNQGQFTQANEFNRGEVAQNNEFNRAQRLQSIEQSGLDYRGRISKVLNQLSDQSEGRLSDPLLDTLLTRTNRNRGADISAASGINSNSGSGINIQDKLDADQRIGLALDAQKTLPGVLTQAQSVLQPPEELNPTALQSPVLQSPTQIPLNPSNIADRIPIQSSISAGAAQQAIGTAATEYEVIPAVTALTTKLGTEQFNESGRFNRDIGVLDRQQGQFTAQDTENLRAGGEIKLDGLRAEQAQQFQAALDQRRQSANLGAAAQFGGALLQSPLGQAVIGGATGALGSIGGAVFDGAVRVIDSVFGNGDGRLMVGDTEVSSARIRDAWNGWTGGGGTRGSGGSSGGGGGSGGYDLTRGAGAPPATVFGGGSGASGGSGSTGDSSDPGLPEVFARGAEPNALDFETVAQGTGFLANFDNYTDTERAQVAGNLVVKGLEARGVLNSGQSREIGQANQAIATGLNPNATPGQKAAAGATLTSLVAGGSYTGSISNPTSIGGVPVVDNTQDGFLLQDGSTVGSSELAGFANGQSAIDAFGVITSDASNETKLAALAGVGIKGAMANGIVDSMAAGYPLAALSVFATGKGFNAMNPVEKAANLTQTANMTYGTISQNIAGQTTANTGSAVLGWATPAGVSGAGAIAGGAAATVIAYDQYKNVLKPFFSGDISYTDAAFKKPFRSLQAYESLGQGLTGSGKSTGRKMRDAWRRGLQDGGLIDDDYKISLADGSKYDIGKDDGAKLINTDGTERNTFDVDWNNKAAVNSIPDAHLFAIATGLDPTDSSKADTFDRVTGQIVNAATSNGKTYEQSQANMKSMLSKFPPEQLGMRLETLRNTDKISEQEYGVYVDRMNSLYGTDFQPLDRQKSTNGMIAEIKQLGDKASPEAKKLLKQLQQPD